MAEIYKHENVQASQQFYGDLLTSYMDMPVAKHLNLLVERLTEGYQDKHPVVAREINNYHPEWLGKSFDLIFDAQMTIKDHQQTIASQYGFQNWNEVESLNAHYFLPFEQALAALLNGETSELQSLLNANPEIVQMKSLYGHEAQLIHYAGNNGVEMWRQQVPLNLAETVQVLLEAGADKTATMKVYGGNYTTYQLFATSAHPKGAGNVEEVSRVLK